MAYPYAFYKLTFGGDLFAGADIWTNGLNFGFPAQSIGFEVGDEETGMSQIATAVSAWFNSSNTFISSSADLRWVKLAFIGQDGKYFREPVLHDFAAPVPGKYAAAVAAQLALAVSFETSKMRAPGKNARIYLPMVGSPVQNDGRITSANAELIRTSTTNLVEAIEEGFKLIDERAPQLIVASQSTPINNVVQKVRVGRVLDTQRRRRNKIDEEYTPSELIIRT